MIKHSIIAIMMLSPMCMVAQEKMNIQFKDATSVSYDVESVEKITFSEEQTPPQPTAGQLVQVGEWAFTYNDQGQCTALKNLEENYTYNIDYIKGTISVMGMSMGNFKLNDRGCLESMTIQAEGMGQGTITMTYNSEGYIIKAVVESSFFDDSQRSESTFNWSNNNLTSYSTHDSGTDDGEPYDDTETCTFTYSDKVNTLGQWTCAQWGNGEPDDLPVQWLGWMGKPSKNFISKVVWSFSFDSYTESDNVSYTFNDDGTINTEIFGDDVCQYRYAGESKAKAPKKAILKGLFGRKAKHAHK